MLFNRLLFCFLVSAAHSQQYGTTSEQSHSKPSIPPQPQERSETTPLPPPPPSTLNSANSSTAPLYGPRINSTTVYPFKGATTSLGVVASPTDSPTCTAPEYNFVKYDTKNNYDATTCLLNTVPTKDCKYWRISVLLLLNNKWYSKTYLQQVQNFINGVTRNCDKQSTLQIFDPGRITINEDCPSAQQKNLISGITTDETLQPSSLTAGDQLDILLEQLHTCSSQKPLAPAEAGVVFVFTDIPCLELCQSANLRTDAQTITNALVLTQGFIMKYMFLSDTVTELDCARNLFPACHSMSPALCDVGVYGNQTLSDSILASRTCLATSSNGPTTADFIIIIGVPSLCITITCSVCAIFHYKKNKYSTRRFLNRWQAQVPTHPKETVSHHHLKNQQLPDPASMVMANHYADIKALANAHKKDPWEIDPSNLYVNENDILGNGAFAVVLKGTLKGKIPLLVINSRLNMFSEHVQENGACEVAVKRLPSHANDQNRLDFFQEISFMKNLGYHAHVISMLGCVSCPVNPMILVEYCAYGDLLRFLRNHRELVLMDKEDVCPTDADMCLRIKDLVSIAWQASDGLTYLASKNFIHRDVAARNVLLTRQLIAKISDFGLGRYADSALYTARGGRLPFKSMALEALKFYEFSEKTDVWAFGILLYEIFSLGDVPYNTVQPMDMIAHLEEGNRPPQPEKCPNEIYALMCRCWKADPDSRPTFAEIRGELAILLNIDDESYGYLSLDSRQLRNMFNRQVTEVHSTRSRAKSDTSMGPQEGSEMRSGVEEGKHIEVTSSNKEHHSDVTTTTFNNDAILPPKIPPRKRSTSTTDANKGLTGTSNQDASDTPVTAQARHSSPDITNSHPHLDEEPTNKPKSKPFEEDFSVFARNILNSRIPEEEREIFLTSLEGSLEEWIQQKLTRDCP
ncbi:unnamed protein product [Cylicocyclus nassatus]|uniref:Protein kinase domain-containing protein n=1 Tax=Cylicocyclus nassatus TaxID=53992 RepID=A0AA36M1T5_CYLNA|nr:unnamed protein product [Cylicocyclus nassatus]